MRIIRISRTVSGTNYSNFEATATISKEDDPIASAIELDKQVRKMIDACNEQVAAENDLKVKKEDALEKLDALRKMIEEERINYLPF